MDGLKSDIMTSCGISRHIKLLMLPFIVQYAPSRSDIDVVMQSLYGNIFISH